MTLTDQSNHSTPAITAEDRDRVRAVIASAGNRLAPLWPLSRFVAVNPYVGVADLRFEQAAELLAASSGGRSTLPIDDYLALIADGRITLDDVQAALGQTPESSRMAKSAADVLAAARTESASAAAEEAAWAPTVPTVGRVANEVTGRDWDRFVTDRICAWAAAYFDEGQAIWRSAAADLDPYTAWKQEAEVDRTPEVAGLRRARRIVRSLPADPIDASALALAELTIPADAAEAYIHTLLQRIGGWAAHARRLGFEGNLYDRPDDRLEGLTAVVLAWELVLARCLTQPELDAAWALAVVELDAAGHQAVRPAIDTRVTLQNAHDHAEQRRLIAAINNAPAIDSTGTDVQAVFCIDVRSEVLRRHLETVAPTVDTLGFAGFFAMPVDYVPIGHGQGEAQCPVLLTPSCSVPERAGTAERTEQAAAARREAHQVQRAWKAFKMGAVSCFSFVGPVGLAYLPKLFTDGAGRTRPVPHPDFEGLPDWAATDKGPDVSCIPIEQRTALAAGALKAMSLHGDLAPIVAIVGHGATTVNNPYDTGLACGACGGHTGEANARVAAAILNDPEVRAALRADGLEIPAGTWFQAALHDTTTDRVHLFDRGIAPDHHTKRLDRLEDELQRAGSLARTERAPRLGIAPAMNGPDLDAAVIRRSNDWAQIRPEWGLAGCRAFIVAPRDHTAGVDLAGQAFLHSYDWHKDDGFGVLELVMTAPMVVASWINLQYYGSTVDPERLGSGNKVLHNVVGRIGVLEGNGGDLRVGLPWQSVHDGTQRQHDPLRLAAFIAAPTAAMNDVIKRHEHVQHLLDHNWVHLYAMNDHGTVTERYTGDLTWATL